MRNTDPKRNKMRVFTVLATLCLLAATAKAAPAEDGFVKFHPITQEQYDEILSLTDGKPVISEGRLISSGMAKFAGFTSGLATGWLPSVIKTFSSSSNNSNKRREQNFPLCVIDTNDLTYDYDDHRSTARGSSDSNGYYRPPPSEDNYPSRPRPGSRPPYGPPPYGPPPGYPGGDEEEEEEEEEPDTTTDGPSRRKPIVNCIVVIKKPDESTATTTTTTTRKPTTTRRPRPKPTPTPPEDEEDEDYPDHPHYGHMPPPPPYPYMDPWTMWYYYKLANAYSSDHQAPPPPGAYPPPYPYPSYPKRTRQNDAAAYMERSPYPQFDYSSEYPKYMYQQSAANNAPYYVRASLKQPKQIQPQPADSEELEDDKDFFSVRKIFG